MIQDKIDENIDILERYQTIFSKENSINDILRKFFKSMHEILYEIEHNKRLELDYKITTIFGPDSEETETNEVFKKLKGVQAQIDHFLKEQNYLECYKLRDEYQAI